MFLDFDIQANNILSGNPRKEETKTPILVEFVQVSSDINRIKELWKGSRRATGNRLE